MDWHYYHSSFIALDRGKRENAHTRSPILLTMGVKKSFHPVISLQGDAETEDMDHEEKKITGMLYGMAPVWNLAKVLKHEGNTVKGMLCGLLRGMIPPGNIRERAIHRVSKHQQPNSREEPVWRRDRSLAAK